MEHTKTLHGHLGHQTSITVTFGYEVISKALFFGDNLTNLAELKNAMHRHAHNIPSDMLTATVKNAVMQCYLVLENGELHIEHALLNISETFEYILN